MNPAADFYFRKAKAWQEEIAKLRSILLDCHLAEELKWGVPCYTFRKKNIVLIHVFRDYCALLFIKGALLKDPEGILVQQTEQVQAGRQVRFTGIGEINRMEALLKSYVFEAVEAEEAGLKVAYRKTAELEMPEEFRQQQDRFPELKAAFEALTPGRQRGYLLYFSAPKQPKTRTARVEKCRERILQGKGLNDR
ncbi:MAG TPA: DUF1801 domain-containing protein [Chitinophagaceae bacterium]|jgi:uncharacterized protein YdeI (YjbR/CyaY-like superfamily)|nr:DUF1801 domain-containing protein [Chitinophagaceae bacterium]